MLLSCKLLVLLSPMEEDLDLMLAEYSDHRAWSIGVLPAEDMLPSPASTLATLSDVIPTATPTSSSSPDTICTCS